MSAFTRQLSLLTASVGWAGGIGLALLVSAGVLGLALLQPAREEGDALNSELQQLKRKLASSASAERPATSLRQQFDEFVSTLPRQDQINAQLTLLNELAARHHLVLKNGEYRTTSTKDGRIGRLQITVKTEGSYPDVRRFLRELPAGLPALSVSRLSLSRQKPADTALETNVEFALFYARAET